MAESDKTPRRSKVRCAIYTRKSTDEGLEQAFNSLDAQREACAAFIQSQKHEGWLVLPALYDDGGYSGGSLERPALKRLLADIEAGQIDVVVVYKVDRLTRALSILPSWSTSLTAAASRSCQSPSSSIPPPAWDV
jgi:DNA invertase Pin-like site-specific DNA recombinase